MLTQVFNSTCYILRLYNGVILINEFYVSLYLFHAAEVHGTVVTPMSSIGNCEFLPLLYKLCLVGRRQELSVK